jgi:hypothetical protein
MTTVESTTGSSFRWPRLPLDVLKRGAVFVLSLTVSYLSVLGLGSFVVAGFLLHPVAGFVVLGTCLLILHKAIDEGGKQ